MDDHVACVRAPEVCNGIDDDCNGVIDEGCPCTSFDFTLPASLQAPYAGLVWTGSGYFTLHDDGTATYVQRITAEGALAEQAAAAPTATSIAYAWTGSQLGVAWRRGDGALAFSRFDPSATLLGTTVVSTQSSIFNPQVVWNRDRFGLAWSATYITEQHIYLAELDPEGQPITDPQLVATPASSPQSIAIAADGYLIAQGSPSGPLAVLVDRTGQLLDSQEIDPTCTNCSDLAIVANGDGFAAVWTHIGKQLYARALDSTGQPTSDAVAIPPLGGGLPIDGTISTGAGGYTVIVVENTGVPTTVAHVELEQDGGIVAGPSQLFTFSTGGWDTPRVAPADHRLGIAMFMLVQTRYVQTCP